jgi:LmbE family N-acetylglucosaminyl deacetylase
MQIQKTDRKSIVIVGAHPDDCEVYAGGLACLLRDGGHQVTFVSTTTGNAGHFSMTRHDLQARRRRECRSVAEYMGVEYIIMDNDDGGLEPTLSNRLELIRILRKCRADMVITHPLSDYHPDHRYTTQLVCDTAYMLNVPLCVPEVPIISKNVAYCHICTKPASNTLTFMVSIDDAIQRKIQAVHRHESQFYEWLPWIEGSDPSLIPADEKGRLAYLNRRWVSELKKTSDEFKQEFPDKFKKSAPDYIEAFTASPYGHALTAENIHEFLPVPGLNAANN